jgi:hypothetical protein
MNFKFAYFFVIFIVFANCNQNSIKKTYESHLARKIEFSENLYYLNGNSTQLTVTFEKYKMIVMLNGNSFKCAGYRLSKE